MAAERARIDREEGCRGGPGRRVLLALTACLALAACGDAEGNDRSTGTGEAAPAEGRAAAAAEAPSATDRAAADSSLRAMARQLTPAVESLASLTFRRPPRLARSSRDDLEAFLLDELAEQWPQERARAVRDAYARLGLVPDTLDLRALLRDLYLEQVVGYYDPEADTLFVREDLGPAPVRPVLVHELVHALQDQHLDLDSLTEARSEDNDAAAAARAVLEGHATYVMTAWELRRRTGGSVDLTRLPDLSEVLGGSDLTSLAGMPRLAGAPAIVRETMIFPYVRGLGLVQSLWRARPERPAPMGRWMPASTEQVLHPGRLLSDPPDRPTAIRFEAPPDGWRTLHDDGLGEFEMRVWLRTLLADTARARQAAAGWDGDRYRLLAGPEGQQALAWATVWDGPAEADAFRRAAEEAYRRLRDEPPGDRVRIRRREVAGRPVVTIWDGPGDADSGAAARALRFRPEGGR